MTVVETGVDEIVGETGQIIGETGVGETGVGETGVLFYSFLKSHSTVQLHSEAHR